MSRSHLTNRYPSSAVYPSSCTGHSGGRAVPTYSRHMTSGVPPLQSHRQPATTYSTSYYNPINRTRSISNGSLSPVANLNQRIERKPLSPRTPSQLNMPPAVSPTAPPASPPSTTHPPPDYDEAAATLRDRGRVGLANIGNTCYMNSIVQCLSHTRPLLDLALTSDDGFSVGRVAGAFRRLLQDLWAAANPAGSLRPSELKASMGRCAARFAGYGQQDAEEFLRYLLEALHEDTSRLAKEKRPKLPPVDYEELDKLPDQKKSDALWERYLTLENSPIVDIFVGQLKSTLECGHCGHKSTTFDPFWDLALPIPSSGRSASLRSCLELFTSHEALDGNEKPVCEKCKTRRRCTKSFSLYRLPKVLVVHLVRFSGERYKTKLNTLVDYPLDLDLTAFVDEDCRHRQQQSASTRYVLYAVSEHSGTPYGGHYTATVRHARAKPTRWLAFDDARVAPSSAEAAVSAQGYVLFYEMVRCGGND